MSESENSSPAQSATEKAKWALLWVASSSIIWQLCSWVFTIIIARILLPEDYGIFALLGAVVPYFEILVTLKLDVWIVQEKDFTKEKESSAFVSMLCMGLFGSALLFFAAPYFAGFYDRPDITYGFQVLALVPLLRAINVFFHTLYRRELNLKPVSILSVILGIFRSVLQIILALNGFGFLALLYGFVAKEIVQTICLFYMRGVPRITLPNWSVLKSAYKFGFYATGASIFWVGTSTLDDIIVGKFLGVEILGYYTMAYQLSELPLSKLNQIVSPVLTSYFSRLKDDSAELFRIFLKVNKALAALIAPTLIGLIIVAPELIPLLLEDKWAPMVPFFQTMCFVWTLRAVGGNISRLLYAIGEPNKNMFYNAATFFLLIPAFLLLVTQYGEDGIYYAWLGVYPLSFFILLYLMTQVTSISVLEFFLRLKAPLIAVTIMGITTMAVKWSLIDKVSVYTLLTACVLTGVVTYSGVLLTIFKDESKEMLVSIKGQTTS